MALKTPGDEMRKIRASDGTELAVFVHDFIEPWVEDKDKETILMHHGSVNDSRVFNAMVPTMTRRYRVVRFDERGMGQSKMAPGTYKASTERFVEDVLNIADELGLEKFHFYAQGSGGMIAVPFAVAHPERLKSLILCQTPYRLPRELIARYDLGEETIGAAIKKYGFEEWNKRVPGYRVFDLSKVDPRLPDWFRSYRAQNPPEVAAGRYDWTFGVDLTEMIKILKVPTLLMNGEGSYQTPTQMGSFIQEQNPNIKVVTLEGGFGQALALVIPDRLAQTALDFIRSI
jgi:pimeloyl-ACP methyl ester carboxylesterase